MTTEIKELHSYDPLSNIYVPGIALWRPVSIFVGGRTEIDDVEFEESYMHAGTYLGRTYNIGQWIHQPELGSNKCNGLVVFIKGKPQPDWTHVVLTGVSGRLRKPRDPQTLDYGGAVFAKTAKPCMTLDVYKAWRRQLYEQISQNLQDSYNEDLQINKISRALRAPSVKQLHNIMWFDSETKVTSKYVID